MIMKRQRESLAALFNFLAFLVRAARFTLTLVKIKYACIEYGMYADGIRVDEAGNDTEQMTLIILIYLFIFF